jgi:hypothetical protein
VAASDDALAAFSDAHTDPVSIKGVDVPLASEPVQLVQRSESP